jgi:hypothetical protein
MPQFFALLLTVALLAAAAPEPEPTRTPQQLLAAIRAQFRTHRPPPTFVTYTEERAQRDDHGFPDYTGSYIYHYYCRTTDRSALKRRVYRANYRGPLEWERVSFNEIVDPGSPSADVFEPAPARPRPPEFVPTPEASAAPLREIATVRVSGEFDYRVVAMETVGQDLHLTIEPTRDPDRNRLREVFADKDTLELKKLVATDKLFTNDGHGPTYGVKFIINMSWLEGRPIVTFIHGVVGANLSNANDTYAGDGKEVDFKFTDVKFPAELPAWYFDKRSYAQHQAEAPT